MPRHRYRSLLIVYSLVLMLCVGCSGGGPTANVEAQPQHSHLRIIGTKDVVASTAPIQLTALQKREDEAELNVTNGVQWSIEPEDHGSINQHGIFRCALAGPITITAAVPTARITLALRCDLPTTSLTVSQKSVSMRIGSTVQLKATAAQQTSPSADVTSVSHWYTSSDVATVSDNGLVACVHTGNALLSVRYLSEQSTVPVSCSAPSWSTSSYFMEQSDEFVGPFPSWTNVRTAFGAKGDGKTDDTKALQAAIDALDVNTATTVVWLPAGDYRISAPLVVRHKSFLSIEGEDPRNTKISWAGPQDLSMMKIDRSTTFRIARLTFDGRNIADSAESVGVYSDETGGQYATFNEFSDQHILGVKRGLDLAVDAETTVQRIWFDSLPLYGITLGNFNTLNIFIDDSLFTHCGTGVTNTEGAGQFIVSSSYFLDSLIADMSIGNTGYFTARHNTSMNSGAFFTTVQGGPNPAQITIQNNTILDPRGIPVQLGDQGPLMLIDNVIRMRDTSLPSVQTVWDNNVIKTVLSFGNTLTSPIPPTTIHEAALQGILYQGDDAIVEYGDIPDAAIPPNVYIPPNLHRTVFEVSPEANGDDIQHLIDFTVAAGYAHAVIHIPSGFHKVSHTIHLPAFSDIQLIGDEVMASGLQWASLSDDPIIRIDSPSATVKYLRIEGGHSLVGDGIALHIRDQPSTHVLVDQASLQVQNQISVYLDGIDHANVEMFSTYTAGALTGVKVTGGPLRKSRKGALGITNFYTGSMQSDPRFPDGTSFDVSAGAQFMVQDNWHDYGGTTLHNFVLSGSGNVTEQGGLVAMSSTKPFVIGDFDGHISLIALGFTGGFDVHPGEHTTKLLTMGLVGNSSDYQPLSTGNFSATNLLNAWYQYGGHQITMSDEPTISYMREMLAQTRSQYPVKRLALDPSASRIRINRIDVAGTKNAIHVMPVKPTTMGVYSLVKGDNSGSLAANASSQSGCGLFYVSPMSNRGLWVLSDAGEGDFFLQDKISGSWLTITRNSNGKTVPTLSQVHTGDYRDRWRVENTGDGNRAFWNRGTNAFLEWTSGASCPGTGGSAGDGGAKWRVIAN